MSRVSLYLMVIIYSLGVGHMELDLINICRSFILFPVLANFSMFFHFAFGCLIYDAVIEIN